MILEDELLAEYNPENFLAALTAACKKIAPQAVLLGNDTYAQEWPRGSLTAWAEAPRGTPSISRPQPVNCA